MKRKVEKKKKKNPYNFLNCRHVSRPINLRKEYVQLEKRLCMDTGGMKIDALAHFFVPMYLLEKSPTAHQAPGP